MSAPARKSRPVTARLSSSGMLSIGRARSDDAPPEMSTTSCPSGGTELAISIARRAAASLPLPGCGCCPTITSSGAGASTPIGGTTRPPWTREPNTSTAAAAIASDALPAAMIHTFPTAISFRDNARRTNAPASTARMPACTICRRSIRSVCVGEVSDCVWGRRRRRKGRSRCLSV